MTLSLQHAEKILLVAPHRLGDTLFATPGVRALRLAKPSAQIDVVALSSLSYEVFINNKCINTVYHAEDCPLSTIASQYDVVLPLQNIQKTQEYVNGAANVLMLPRYTGDFHYSENFYRFVLQQFPEIAQFPPGPYELNYSEEDVAQVDRLLSEIPATVKPFLLAIHMGCHRIAKEGNRFLYKLFPFLATKDSRSWPFKRFNALIQKLLKINPNLYILLTGSPNERFAADSLKPDPRIINLMGSVNVNQLVVLLKRCNVLVTGDTGPMHVGCVADIPIVMLCGETDPKHTGPYPRKPHHCILQKKGMKRISVNEVYDALKKF